jgi:hypothetical protein
MKEEKLSTIATNIENILVKNHETVTRVCYEGECISFHYSGVPLGYDALKEIEALVFSNCFDEESFNKFIPFGMNGEYTLSVSLPNAKSA